MSSRNSRDKCYAYTHFFVAQIEPTCKITKIPDIKQLVHSKTAENAINFLTNLFCTDVPRIPKLSPPHCQSLVTCHTQYTPLKIFPIFCTIPYEHDQTSKIFAISKRAFRHVSTMKRLRNSGNSASRECSRTFSANMAATVANYR